MVALHSYLYSQAVSSPHMGLSMLRKLKVVTDQSAHSLVGVNHVHSLYIYVLLECDEESHCLRILDQQVDQTEYFYINPSVHRPVIGVCLVS